MTTEEYNQIIEQQSDALYRFLLKNTRCNELANDLVQTSFEKLWKAKQKVEFGKAKSYLFKIGYNAMIDEYRKNKKMHSVEQIPEKAFIPNNLNFELKEWLDLGLSQLSETYRALITLRDYEGYSYKEIGELTNLSESQVKVYIFRARKELKQFFLSNYKQEMINYGYSSK